MTLHSFWFTFPCYSLPYFLRLVVDHCCFDSSPTRGGRRLSNSMPFGLFNVWMYVCVWVLTKNGASDKVREKGHKNIYFIFVYCCRPHQTHTNGKFTTRTGQFIFSVCLSACQPSNHCWSVYFQWILVSFICWFMLFVTIKICFNAINNLLLDVVFCSTFFHSFAEGFSFN